MATKADLKPCVIEALTALNGGGRVIEVAKRIWQEHEDDLRHSGGLFYTWQYDMRWAAQDLQDEGKLSKAGKNRSWVLTL